MVRVMTATELKAQLLAVLDSVAAGEQVEITKRGKAVARLVPTRGPHGLRGLHVGVAATAASDDELFTTGAAWDAE